MKKFISFTLIVAALLSGCRNGELDSGLAPEKAVQSERYSRIPVNLMLDHGDALAPTKSIVSVDEAEVRSVAMFAFGADGKVLLYDEDAGEKAGTPIIAVSDGNAFEWELPVFEDVTVYALANYGDMDLSSCKKASLTIKDLEALKYTCKTVSQMQKIEQSGIPMSGVITVNLTPTDTFRMPLRKLYAKYIFNLDLSGFEEAGAHVEAVSFSARNVNTSVHWFSPEGGDKAASKSALASIDRATEEQLDILGEGQRSVVLYVLENMQGDIPGAHSWYTVESDLGKKVALCTNLYLHIRSVKQDGSYISTAFTIYLGKGNDFSNFDVQRNISREITLKLNLITSVPRHFEWLNSTDILHTGGIRRYYYKSDLADLTTSDFSVDNAQFRILSFDPQEKCVTVGCSLSAEAGGTCLLTGGREPDMDAVRITVGLPGEDEVAGSALQNIRQFAKSWNTLSCIAVKQNPQDAFVGVRYGSGADSKYFSAFLPKGVTSGQSLVEDAATGFSYFYDGAGNLYYTIANEGHYTVSFGLDGATDIYDFETIRPQLVFSMRGSITSNVALFKSLAAGGVFYLFDKGENVVERFIIPQNVVDGTGSPSVSLAQYALVDQKVVIAETGKTSGSGDGSIAQYDGSIGRSDSRSLNYAVFSPGTYQPGGESNFNFIHPSIPTEPLRIHVMMVAESVKDLDINWTQTPEYIAQKGTLTASSFPQEFTASFKGLSFSAADDRCIVSNLSPAADNRGCTVIPTSESYSVRVEGIPQSGGNNVFLINLNFKAELPRIAFDAKAYHLPFNGSATRLGVVYKDAAGAELPPSSFDAEQYNRLLNPVVRMDEEGFLAESVKIGTEQTAGRNSGFLAELTSLPATDASLFSSASPVIASPVDRTLAEKISTSTDLYVSNPYILRTNDRLLGAIDNICLMKEVDHRSLPLGYPHATVFSVTPGSYLKPRRQIEPECDLDKKYIELVTDIPGFKLIPEKKEKILKIKVETVPGDDRIKSTFGLYHIAMKATFPKTRKKENVGEIGGVQVFLHTFIGASLRECSIARPGKPSYDDAWYIYGTRPKNLASNYPTTDSAMDDFSHEKNRIISYKTSDYEVVTDIYCPEGAPDALRALRNVFPSKSVEFIEFMDIYQDENSYNYLKYERTNNARYTERKEYVPDNIILSEEYGYMDLVILTAATNYLPKKTWITPSWTFGDQRVYYYMQDWAADRIQVFTTRGRIGMLFEPVYSIRLGHYRPEYIWPTYSEYGNQWECFSKDYYPTLKVRHDRIPESLKSTSNGNFRFYYKEDNPFVVLCVGADSNTLCWSGWTNKINSFKY